MHDEEIEVGLTGARFGSPSTRKRLRKQRPQPEPQPAATPEPEPDPELPELPALTGARFGSPSLRKRLRAPEPEPEPEPVPEPEPEPTVVLDLEPDWPVLEDTSALVRPYARTGGRTTAAVDLGLETLISTEEHKLRFATNEQLPMMRLCVHPRSVAEIAALSDIPLGVARILLSDLIGAGLVSVHAREAPGMGLLERVLAGLHRL